MIKAYLKGEQNEWDRNLGCLAGAYRATVHDSTGMTPNLLMLGREVRLPSEIMYRDHKVDDVDNTTYGDYVNQLREKMRHAHEVAQKHLKTAAQKHKESYDVKLVIVRYEPGDLVWYRTDIGQLKFTPKLRSAFQGPYLVLKRMSDLVYMIQLKRQGDRKVVHHNKLKPYRGHQKLTWAKSALKALK